MFQCANTGEIFDTLMQTNYSYKQYIRCNLIWM